MDRILTATLILIFCAVGYRFPAWAKHLLAFSWLRVVGAIAAIGVIGLYGFAFCSYLFIPDYVDHTQPHFISVAWYAMHGHPLYPDWTGGDAYGAIYGPLGYFIDGIFLLMSPTITMSKIPGIMAGLVSVGCLGQTLRAKGIGGRAIFLLLAAYVADLMCGDFYSYNLASDSFLVLLSSLSLLTVSPRKATTQGAYVGALTGLATGFRLDGFLYFGPTAINMVTRSKNRREIRSISAALVFAALAAMLIVHFCFLNIDGYLQYILFAAKHGVSPDLFGENVEVALLYALPLLFLDWWRKPQLTRNDKGFIAGLGLSTLAIIMVASKPGAGLHHLIPLAPAYIYAIAIFLKAPAGQKFSAAQQGGFLSLIVIMQFVCFGPEGFKWDEQQWRQSASWAGEIKIAELENMFENHPGAQMGVTNNIFEADTFYRVLANFKGTPLHVDFSEWMDLSFSGASDDDIIWLVSGCHIPAWIMPRGEPFSMYNPYTFTALFSDRFRQTFFANYEPAEAGEIYQVWVCK